MSRKRQQHTQGPWRSEETTVYSGPCPIAHTDTTTPGHTAEDIANAEFIAAAPETERERDQLLRAAEAMQERLQNPHYATVRLCPEYAGLSLAIAKAKGGQG